VIARAALLFLTLALAAPGFAADRERTLSDMMSEVQRLQARMAVGDKTAYTEQQGRLRAIGAAISASKPETWKDKSETDAVADYILSGGQPREVARLLESGDVPSGEDSLLRGALAYTTGREREAEALLGDIDPKKTSLRLAGQLAYARSVLQTARNPRQAIVLLDLARLLAPGTLVEEAALRREILLVGDQRDGDRVVFLSRQYVTRFGHSIYAEDFIQGLAKATTRFGLGDEMASFRKFDLLLSLLSPDQRRLFLLTVAREQILNGKFEVAGAAARQALNDASPGSTDEARAKLFVASAKFVTEDYDAGVGALKAVDRAKLDKPDQDLRDAMVYSATHLRDPPTDAANAEADREERVAAASFPDADRSQNADSASLTIERAERILGRAAALNSPKSPP